MKIDISEDNLGMLLLFAMRDALGRRAYMVHVVYQIVAQYAKFINQEDISTMIRDIEEQEKFGYGDQCDRSDWMKLLEFLKSLGEASNEA